MTPLNAVWIIAAVGLMLTLALLFLRRAFRQSHKRKRLDAMQEQPWSPEALALLGEPLDRADGLPGSTQWLLDKIVETAGKPGEAETSFIPDTPEARTPGPETPIEKHAQDKLEVLLHELPLQAGAGEVGRTLEKVALSALGYYRYALLQDSPDLPINVTSATSTSLSPDASLVAGYLDLEQRMGGLAADLQPAQTASSLLGAVAARALGIDGVEGLPDDRFVHAAVSTLLKGAVPASAAGKRPLNETTPPGDASRGEPLRWRAGGLT
ncbi:MAG: hypothetical protein KY393_08795 [Actinobacteria bacterium]|nr:hypothetical protein [Actinomycetota bacterium]